MPLIGREINCLINRIDDDEIISGAMHFCEFKFHHPSLSVAMTKTGCESVSTGRSDMQGNYNKFKLIKPDSRVS